MEVLLICDLGEVLHDWFEARMVGGGLEAGLRLRPRPRLVLRLVLEALVSQTALPCSNSGERRASSPLRTSVVMVELMSRLPT